MRKVVHLLARGEIGGAETLMLNYGLVSKLDHTFVMVWGGGTVCDTMREKGLKTVVLGEEEGHPLHTLRAIVSYCIEAEPDTVVAHLSPQCRAALLILKFRRPGIRRIAYAHSNARDMIRSGGRLKTAFTKALHGMGFRAADRVICISESVAASVREIFHVPPDKITVVYNGIPLEKFRPAAAPAAHPGEIIYVGRLIEGKGVQVVLRALSKVRVGFHFSVIGDGPYRAQLEGLAGELGLSGRVTFLGAREDVAKLLEDADIFISTPVLDEGFGNAIAEALAAGLVCIASRSGAIPELIKDHVNGYLVDKDDPAGLSEVISQVLFDYDSEQNKSIRAQAVRDAEQYSLATYAMRMDDILDEKT